MPIFGKGSMAQRATLHPKLQRVLDLAITRVDFTIVEGHRGKEAQNDAFRRGASKLQWPKGNHNKSPSTAADVMPFPIDWSDDPLAIARVAFLMGVIKACGDELKIALRFGFDWNGNLDPRDETFIDWDHVELRDP